MNPTHAFFLIIGTALWLTAWIAAVASIASARLPLSALTRVLWIAVAIILPVLGPLVWFIWGRQHFMRAGSR